MESGVPRMGDEFIENNYPVGSVIWHEIEANNTLYRQRKSEPLPPQSTNDVLMMKLISHHRGMPLGVWLERFKKKE